MPRGEMLVFGEDNQGGFSWSLLWTLDGPKRIRPSGSVRTTNWRSPSRNNSAASSSGSSLHEASVGADFVARSFRLTAEQVDRLAEVLRLVPLRPFWPVAPTRFYVAPGLVLHVTDEGNDNGFSAWAALPTAVLSPPWPVVSVE